MEGLSKVQNATSAQENKPPEQEKAPERNETPEKPNPMIAVLERHEKLSNRLKQNGAK